jgi:hypothetical protein
MPSNIEGRPEERPHECARDILVAAADAPLPQRRATASETMRMYWSIMLAKDVEVCASLLRGELVDEAALDADWLELAKELRVIGICDTFDHFFPNVVGEEQRYVA